LQLSSLADEALVSRFFYDIFIACILCVFGYGGVWIVFSGAGWGGGCWRQGAG
jgi:hypothetical protein